MNDVYFYFNAAFTDLYKELNQADMLDELMLQSVGCLACNYGCFYIWSVYRTTCL